MSDTQAAEGTEAEEQSMEEILQSIRRIITEDEENAEANAQEADENEGSALETALEDSIAGEEAEEVAVEKEPNGADEISADDLDALMAMDMPAEDGAPAALEEPTPETVEEEAPADDPLADIDALMAEPAAPAVEEAADADKKEEELAEESDSDILELTEIIEDEPVAEEAPKPMPEPVMTMEDIIEASSIEPEAAPEAPESEPESEPEIEMVEVSEQPSIAAPVDSMLSDETAAVTAALFQEVKQGVQSLPAAEMPDFRSGTTVEDLMIEAMRPMLKEWLDANLPSLVERVVQAEIQKLSK